MQLAGIVAVVLGGRFVIVHYTNSVDASRQQAFFSNLEATSCDVAMAAAKMPAAKREGAYKKCVGSWSADQKAALEQLNRAADAYFKAHARSEIDLSGQIPRSLPEEFGMRRELDGAVDDFEIGRLPGHSAAEFAQADKELNETYRGALKKAGGEGMPPNVNNDGIRQSQQLWLAYVEAWLRFAALRYPAVSADSMKTLLTEQRIAALKAIPLGD